MKLFINHTNVLDKNQIVIFKNTIMPLSQVNIKEGKKVKIKFNGDEIKTWVINRNGNYIPEELDEAYIKAREEEKAYTAARNEEIINRLIAVGFVEITKEDEILKYASPYQFEYVNRIFKAKSFANYPGEVIAVFLKDCNYRAKKTKNIIKIYLEIKAINNFWDDDNVYRTLTFVANSWDSNVDKDWEELIHRANSNIKNMTDKDSPYRYSSMDEENKRFFPAIADLI